MYMSMLLNGTNVQDQGPTESQDCLTLSQLVHFNLKCRGQSTGKTRHSND